MRLYYGDDFDTMIIELRGQNHKAMRMQTLKKIEGNIAHLETNLSAFCNSMVYLAKAEYSCKLPPEGGNAALEVLNRTINEFENIIKAKCSGLDIKRGIMEP
ncbi:MAG TPA: hypothetical protein PL033_01280 [Candidatus Brocadiia bacterium]|nr:hypothetical protein [Candidatus Brocadiia bacterium]